MAINKLSAGHLKKKGAAKYGDGGGLWLYVTADNARRWVFRYRFEGKDREMGLGSANDISLERARELAKECRALKSQGIDPISHKREEKTELTFDDCAEKFIESQKSGWKSEKHASQWANTISTYASPVFGSLPVSKVNTALVMQVLEPIWHIKNETASRVRGRIENILSWAIVHGHHPGANPALWRGHLDKLLPKPSRVHKVRHHPALPYAEVPAYVQSLSGNNTVSATALTFTILTACRTGEVIKADWSEIDLSNKVWIIPDDRMKAGIEQRVPLSRQAIAVLKLTPNYERKSGWVFPSTKLKKNKQQPLSNMAMLELLRGSHPGKTVHGFRSSFRDWAGETTNFPREVIEHALAHRLADKAEAAYQRGDLLEKRKKLMQSWADWCDRKTGGNVVQMKK